MGIGISILVGAVGAILRYAVTGPAEQGGFDIHSAGMILMIVGLIGLAFSMMFWSRFAPFGPRARSISLREETTIDADGQEPGRIVRASRDRVTE